MCENKLSTRVDPTTDQVGQDARVAFWPGTAAKLSDSVELFQLLVWNTDSEKKCFTPKCIVELSWWDSTALASVYKQISLPVAVRIATCLPLSLSPLLSGVLPQLWSILSLFEASVAVKEAEIHTNSLSLIEAN